MLLLYMSALRTQIYLTAEQRRDLDALAAREGATLAGLIREAVDEYLAMRPGDADHALRESFGSIPDAAAVPRHEWDRRSANRS